MAEFTERLQSDIQHFRDRVFEDPTGVLDPEGVVHHEFVSGNHGRKLDFDKIETDSDFYIEWVSIYARAIKGVYGNRLPDALVGIANGANRLSTSIAPLLGVRVLGLTTEKVNPKKVRLDERSIELLQEHDVQFALTVEDVGTTGSTTATANTHLRKLGVRRIESSNGFQRNAVLPHIAEQRIPHWAVISEQLPMYTPEECAELPVGYCAQGVELVVHD